MQAVFDTGRLGRMMGGMLLSCLLIVGCSGGDLATLNGKVTFDGQPVADGTIRFMPSEGTPGHGAGAKISNGSYSIPKDSGLMAGMYTVLISATREATAAEVAKMNADRKGSVEPGEESVAPKVQLIPEKYNIATRLTATVTKGANTQDFNLDP